MKAKARQAVSSLALALCIALPAAVFAQGAGLTVSAAESRPQGSMYGYVQIGGVSPSDGDTTWSVSGTLGYYFMPNVALEGSVGYYSVDYRDGEEDVWPASFSIKAGLPVRHVYPYLIAGVDMQYVDAEIGGRSDSDTPFGYHLGAGIEFPLSPNVYAGIDYRYTWIEADLFGVKQRMDGGSTSFTLGVRF